jgi:hypothetical protein
MATLADRNSFGHNSTAKRAFAVLDSIHILKMIGNPPENSCSEK